MSQKSILENRAVKAQLKIFLERESYTGFSTEAKMVTFDHKQEDNSTKNHAPYT